MGMVMAMVEGQQQQQQQREVVATEEEEEEEAMARAEEEEEEEEAALDGLVASIRRSTAACARSCDLHFVRAQRPSSAANVLV